MFISERKSRTLGAFFFFLTKLLKKALRLANAALPVVYASAFGIHRVLLMRARDKTCAAFAVPLVFISAVSGSVSTNRARTDGMSLPEATVSQESETVQSEDQDRVYAGFHCDMYTSFPRHI